MSKGCEYSFCRIVWYRLLLYIIVLNYNRLYKQHLIVLVVKVIMLTNLMHFIYNASNSISWLYVYLHFYCQPLTYYIYYINMLVFLKEKKRFLLQNIAQLLKCNISLYFRVEVGNTHTKCSALTCACVLSYFPTWVTLKTNFLVTFSFSFLAVKRYLTSWIERQTDHTDCITLARLRSVSHVWLADECLHSDSLSPRKHIVIHH